MHARSPRAQPDRRVQKDVYIKNSHLRLLDAHAVDVLKVERPQYLALAVDDVERWLRAELDLDQASIIGVQPLAHDHLVHADLALALLHRLLEHLQPAPLAILELDEAVAYARADYRYEAEEDAHVDVDELAAL